MRDERLYGKFFCKANCFYCVCTAAAAALFVVAYVMQLVYVEPSTRVLVECFTLAPSRNRINI